MLQKPFFRPRQLSFFDSLRKDTKNLKQINYFLCYFIKKCTFANKYRPCTSRFIRFLVPLKKVLLFENEKKNKFSFCILLT